MNPFTLLKILLTASLTLALHTARAEDDCCPEDKAAAAPGKPDAHAGHDHAAAAAATPPDAHAGHDHGAEEGGICGEHNLPEAECAICNPGMVEAAEVGRGPKLRLASAQSLDKAGVSTGAAAAGSVADRITAPVEIQMDPVRHARVLSPVRGTVREVLARPGARVAKGDVLARIVSREVGDLRAEHERAAAGLELARLDEQRERTLVESSVGAKSGHARAVAALRAAEAGEREIRGRLELLGVPPGEEGSTLDLRAPLEGVVLAAPLIPGGRVAEDEEAFELADLDTVRARIKIQPGQVGLVATGAVVRVHSGTPAPDGVESRVDRVNPLLDPVTRRVEVFASLPNPAGTLRPGMLLLADVATSATQTLPLLPVGAVQAVDSAHVVFVKLADDLYEVRRVRPGPRAGDSIAIAAGLAAGEMIALTNTQVLKAELLKSRMGAGCGDH